MPTRTHTPLISIVTPVFNEEKALPAFLETIETLMRTRHYAYELLLVDDGSTDGTPQLLEAAHARNPAIKYLRFSRNFGKEIATTAGLDFASGEVVIPMDADLQDPPELIPDMIVQWQQGFDVVLAIREDRKYDSWLKRVSARAFYGLMQRFMRVKITPNAGDFRLMDKRVVEVVRSLRERARFMKGLLSWPGFATTSLSYSRPARSEGASRWNYSRLWGLALDGIFSFTSFPLKVWTYIGALIAFSSFAYACWIVIHTLLHGVDVPGYASLIAVVLFMGGVQLISLGVIGEYIARIYEENKQRPLYVIAHKAGV